MTVRGLLRETGDAIRSYWQGPWGSSDPYLASMLGGGTRTASGVSVNEANALSYAPVWSAVRRISADIASLPLHLYKRGSGGKEKFARHPLYRLMHDEANPEMSADEFRETLQAHILLWGNGYAEIIRNGLGQPVQLLPIE